MKELKISEHVDYVLVCGSTNGDLRQKVLDRLDLGYRLYGTPFVSADHFCQAMIKGNKMPLERITI